MHRLLVIEDDESIALGLKMNLTAEGYEVQLASDGQLGLDLAFSQDYDLILLDLMLPKQNGFEIVQRLREAKNSVPIIMLTARGAEEDKVMGLNLGAEDYITKPFSLAELLARVKAVLRRAELLRSELLRSELLRSELKNDKSDLTRVYAGDLVIDAGTHQVHCKGELVNLTATEFEVLWCLVAARGQVLSREEIQTQVWGPGHHGTLRTIDNFLLQLRSKLEEEPSSPRHLLTIRGVGYRFSSGE